MYRLAIKRTKKSSQRSQAAPRAQLSLLILF